ncbi:MAG: radical SAM protein, partial [Thermoprotei archaeon]|nr:radical SAM protein [Thermoprotei archaeon]
MLVDKFGRVITTLRLIVTYRCNLSCFFCHHEGAFPERELLDAKDYGFVAKVGVSLGITKYRITGGEPLIRKDIVDIVSEIAQVDGVEDLSITTNGTLITRRLLEELKEAGLDRINISLHTLDRAHYKEITGKDMLDKVLSG